MFFISQNEAFKADSLSCHGFSAYAADLACSICHGCFFEWAAGLKVENPWDITQRGLLWIKMWRIVWLWMKHMPAALSCYFTYAQSQPKRGSLNVNLRLLIVSNRFIWRRAARCWDSNTELQKSLKLTLRLLWLPSPNIGCLAFYICWKSYFLCRDVDVIYPCCSLQWLGPCYVLCHGYERNIWPYQCKEFHIYRCQAY